MAISVTRLSYADAIKEAEDTKELYVMNNSAGQNERPRGIIHLSMKEGDRERAVEIASTWFPINLLEHFGIAAVKESSNFRDYIRGYHLVAISTKQAKEIMNSDAAKGEFRRWQELQASLPGASKANLTGESITIQTGGGAVAMNMPPIVKAADEPSAHLAELVNRFNAGTVSDDQAAATVNELYKNGSISITQLQMGVSSIKNTSSNFYRAIENLISDPMTITSVPAPSSESQVSFS